MINHFMRPDGNAVVLISGRFDFSTHEEVRRCFDNALKESTKDIHLDLGKVDYLDSSALGLLLVLRDKAKHANRQIVLINVQGLVKQVLDIANFKKLFNIASR